MVSVVIVSGTFTDYERKLTQQAVDSCRAATPDAQIIVMETHTPKVGYEGAQTHYIAGPFNYNRTLNAGAKLSTYEHIGFFNNDVFFHRGWAAVLLDAMRRHGLHSASPFSRFHRGKPYPYRKGTGVKLGYGIGIELCGWAIVTTRAVLQQIGGFDERVDFWYSDNLYADQLQANGLKHGLITDSVVDHLEGGSLTLFRYRSRIPHLTQGQRNKYNNARKTITQGHKPTIPGKS